MTLTKAIIAEAISKKMSYTSNESLEMGMGGMDDMKKNNRHPEIILSIR